MTATSFSLATQLKFRFSPYEDRLLLSSSLKKGGSMTVLMTRRLVLLTLQQLLKQLPVVTGLEQTPSHYWQEVLQLNHQKALQQRQVEARKNLADTSSTQAESETSFAPVEKSTAELYLATEVVCELQPESRILNLGLKGLKLPEAMVQAQPNQPLVAFSLNEDNLHQVIHQLVTQAQQAQWNLPLNLPWLDTTSSENSSRFTTQ